MAPDLSYNECIVNHRVFSEPLKFYTELLADIENAQKTICFETYKFVEDSIGTRFRDVLTKKSLQGVKIKLMIDSWGAMISSTFFDELIRNGGQVRYFMKLKYNFDAFTKHHRRNHRKVIVIDDHIAYLGSANINEYSLNWRELIVKLEGRIARPLKKSFNDSWKIYKKNTFNIRRQTSALSCDDLKIIRDVPSLTRQRVKKKFESLIKHAHKQIIIETPYFLPGYYLRKLLMDAGKRGVDVKIITPKQSDVGFVDILRSKYLGMMHKHYVKLLFYKPYNLHAKLMLVDNEIFYFGTSNFDYRSFRYMYELMLTGKNKSLIQDLIVHVNETIENCEEFDYELWKRRPFMHKFFENLLIPFRHYL
jgi:cardiolipin synthase A/B